MEKIINNFINQVYNRNKNTVGTVGARLHFEDNSLQHYGMLMFIKKEWVQNNRLTRFEITKEVTNKKKYREFEVDYKKFYKDVLDTDKVALVYDVDEKHNGFSTFLCFST